MQLSEFTYIFLTLCIPFLYYIVRSTSPKKGFSMLFAALIALNVLLKADNFSFLGLFFIAFYLYSYGKKESIYYLSLSFTSFSAGLLNEISVNTLKSIIPVLLVSSVFSLMMIGHWFLVDPTINRDGMKQSPNFNETSKVAEISNCPVVISGGVSSIDDIKKAKYLKNIEGIIVGKAIYDGDIK